MSTLFDIDEREQCAGPHVLLPNMSFACGGNVCTKMGGFVFLDPDNFERVGCPDCRAVGHGELLAEQSAMQGRQASA